jgi:hypothetical protein
MWGTEGLLMDKKARDSDSETKARLWLGGEAVVRRYPRNRQWPSVFNGTLTSLMVLAMGLGFAGGLWIGVKACRRGAAAR